LNLLGRDNKEHSTHLYGEAVEKDDLELARTDPFWSASVTYHQGILFTYFGEHTRQADMMVELGHDYLAKALVASPNIIVDTCLKGLSCFDVARQTRRKKYARLAQICRSKIKKWLDMGNPNVMHYDSILDAEAMALKGEKLLQLSITRWSFYWLLVADTSRMPLLLLNDLQNSKYR
jgi:hypothetical protein